MSLNWDYSGLEKRVVSGDYSGLQREIQNYTDGYIIIYSRWIGTTMGYIGDMYSRLKRITAFLRPGGENTFFSFIVVKFYTFTV